MFIIGYMYICVNVMVYCKVYLDFSWCWCWGWVNWVDMSWIFLVILIWFLFIYLKVRLIIFVNYLRINFFLLSWFRSWLLFWIRLLCMVRFFGLICVCVYLVKVVYWWCILVFWKIIIRIRDVSGNVMLWLRCVFWILFVVILNNWKVYCSYLFIVGILILLFWMLLGIWNNWLIRSCVGVSCIIILSLVLVVFVR